ncbi:MAG: nicotinate phosphoribosyltransferase [Treponema sp.]|jgi:nicotinate phosphoribosyltransferase|nr:nicotinate phosphoribosyltransferase [Treponema sp.]
MNKSSALFTDFYALTMAQGYWKNNLNRQVVFEMFFRRQPFEGGFSVFAGLGTLLDKLQNFFFSADDLVYLRGLGLFEEAFLDYLKGFRFTGSVWAMDEGTVIFPQEPLVRITGRLIECQIIEGMILNTINFQSLIATKTARTVLASGNGTIMEFGLRRAQGFDGAMSASRAAFIGGAAGTSNVLAGKEFGIPVMGTMAHSWIMAHASEEEAFQAYADLYPNHPVFLIDTYDTLKSGAPNAVKVGKRLAARGQNFGVRLDSGDMHYLSMEVRKLFDAAGLTKATIAVSNDLDETIIQALTDQGAPINSWGVGTQMVTGGSEAAFTGVYKLTLREDSHGTFLPVMKLSDNPEKTTNPGVKQVWRIADPQGMAVADVLSLDDPVNPDILEKHGQYVFWHTSGDYRHFAHTLDGSIEPLLKLRMDQGQVLGPNPSLEAIRGLVHSGLSSFDASYKRLLNPHIYKVSITERLRDLKQNLIKSFFHQHLRWAK